MTPEQNRKTPNHIHFRELNVATDRAKNKFLYTLIAWEREILYDSVLGLTYQEIQEKYGISYQTVAHHLVNAYRRLEIRKTPLKAAILVFKAGLIEDVSELKEKVNFDLFERLRPRHLDILRTMTQENGKYATNEQIAKKHNLSKYTVENHFSKIFKLLEFKGVVPEKRERVVAGLMYLQYVRDLNGQTSRHPTK